MAKWDLTLGEWIQCGDDYGFVIARRTEESNALLIIGDYDSDETVKSMVDRGCGYCVQWVRAANAGWLPARKRWISAKSMQDKRYHVIPNPFEKTAKTDEAQPDQQPLILDLDEAMNSFLLQAVRDGDKAREILKARGIAA